jgi:hypothetical protein
MENTCNPHLKITRPLSECPMISQVFRCWGILSGIRRLHLGTQSEPVWTKKIAEIPSKKTQVNSPRLVQARVLFLRLIGLLISSTGREILSAEIKCCVNRSTKFE